MTTSRNYVFGSGVMIATPTGANPTPVLLGELQEVNIDISFSTKLLHGQYQFPVALGRGTAKITGKAKYARFSAGALGLFLGLTPASGTTIMAFGEAGTIPGTPFAVTVANSATWAEDKGVAFALTGEPLTRVASSPATGQYSVAAGVYTFAAADTTLGVLINYNYTNAVAPQKTITMTNPLLGAGTQFQVDTSQWSSTLNQQTGMQLFACQSSKLTIPGKLEDFTVYDFDFEAYANAANQIGKFFMPG